tara:strand:+ start:94 stop:612 length:519 start_codon:yes stop_codon:yes gene_type:complete
MGMAFIGVVMLLIGMLLLVNALWLQGKVETRDVGVFNLMIGLLTVGYSAYLGVQEGNAHLSAAFMLFGVTYAWVGVNAIRGATDQKALGFYCLLVAILTLPFAYKTFLAGDLLFTIEWIAFGITWFLFYKLLFTGSNVVKPLVMMVYLVGFGAAFTGWSMLYGYWPYISLAA